GKHQLLHLCPFGHIHGRAHHLGNVPSAVHRGMSHTVNEAYRAVLQEDTEVCFKITFLTYSRVDYLLEAGAVLGMDLLKRLAERTVVNCRIEAEDAEVLV